MRIFRALFSNLLHRRSVFEDYIFKIIKHTGPMSVHNFMREILTNEDHGYYMHRKVFGEKGDFITSPEISQMFGELIGVWIVNEWINQKKHQPFQIVELGPGKASMIYDAIIAIGKFPELLKTLSIKLVEVSPQLRCSQKSVLNQCFNKLDCEISVEWFDSLDQVPNEMPSCYLAHEFFDALPIHKFKRNNHGKWREILIDVEKDVLKFILSNKETSATLAFKNILDRKHSMTEMEFSPASLSILDIIAKRIDKSGGFALIADYGHLGEKGDTFRAFKDHQLSDPLTHLGHCDLTADVDFEMFSDHLRNKFSEKLNVHGPICQHSFLKNMGIDFRLKMLLSKSKSQEEVDYLVRSYRMMMDVKEMGERFKFISLLPKLDNYHVGYVPAGFCELS